MSPSNEWIVYLCRTLRFSTGCRGVLYLPDGSAVHTIEDDPIPPGRYVMRPDDTGDYQNWVVERVAGSRIAAHEERDYLGHTHRPARTDVEFHVGNTLSDTSGCILPGQQCIAAGVGASSMALEHMLRVLDRHRDPPAHGLLEIFPVQM